MEKYLTLKDLRQALKEAGLPSTKGSILYWEKTGKLKCRRSSYSKTHSWRLFTEKEIKEIVLAFSPNGKGFWKYGD